MIYLNCAATSHQRPECVVTAVADAMRTFGSCGRGAHESELAAARSIALARERVSALLGFGHPERLVFAANTTEALNMAILGTVPDGGRVVATDWDHNSILRPLYRLRDERGVTLSFAAADRHGVLDIDALVNAIVPGTSLVCLTHASNLTGNVLSREELARVVKAAHGVGAPVLLDCAQTAGARPICMDELGIDLVAFTGHKALMGPQGTGGLAVAPGVDVHPVLRGGTGVLSFEEGQPAGYPEHLEAGTLNGHGLAGLHAALDFILRQGAESIGARERQLMRRFYEGVRGIPGVTVYGDFTAPERAAIVTLNIRDYDSAEIADILAEDYGIATRAGAHCAPRMHEALGTVQQGAVRFSFSFFNTEEEADAAVSAVRELAEE